MNDKSPKIGRKLDTLLEIIASRRSVRKLKTTQIPESDIRTLLWAATMAPSGANMQPWKFIVIKNKQLQDKLANLVLEKTGKFEKRNILSANAASRIRDSNFFGKAPALVAVLVNYNQAHHGFLEKIAKAMKVNISEAIFPDSGFVEIQSAAAAIENLLLVAHAMGYGACWLRIPSWSKDDLEHALIVKKPWHLMAFIPLGLPDETPDFPGRKGVDEVKEDIE
jgi:nitroreductase